MKATETLKSEHRVIEPVLECLTLAADQFRRGGPFEARTVRRVIEFAREFADRCHHVKEEWKLLPSLQGRVSPSDRELVETMFIEHATVRSHVSAMADALPKAERGDAIARAAVAEHARQYADLLRRHIETEDQRVFVLADVLLTPADQQALVDAFELIDAEDARVGSKQHLLTLVEQLGAEWHVAAPKTEAVSRADDCRRNDRPASA